MMTSLLRTLPRAGSKGASAAAVVMRRTAGLSYQHLYRTICSRSAQTVTSAIGPNAFYPSTLEESKVEKKIKTQEPPPPVTPAAVLKKAYIHISQETPASCPVQAQLHLLAPKMNERVFFYNEKNPHAGLIFNIKELIYNHYKLLGPVKSAWYHILTQHYTLTNLLLLHLRQHTHVGVDDNKSLAQLTQLLESLESKRGISSCKYEKSVKEGQNLIQFKYCSLRSDELIALQVLAQYAHYDYEII